jgi:hypothetical protein
MGVENYTPVTEQIMHTPKQKVELTRVYDLNESHRDGYEKLK